MKDKSEIFEILWNIIWCHYVICITIFFGFCWTDSNTHIKKTVFAFSDSFLPHSSYTVSCPSLRPPRSSTHKSFSALRKPDDTCLLGEATKFFIYFVNICFDLAIKIMLCLTVWWFFALGTNSELVCSRSWEVALRWLCKRSSLNIRFSSHPSSSSSRYLSSVTSIRERCT